MFSFITLLSFVVASQALAQGHRGTHSILLHSNLCQLTLLSNIAHIVNGVITTISSSPPSATSCPTYSCASCPTGQSLTITATGTECPHCSCIPISTTKPTTTTTTKAPVCTTYACASCPIGQHETLTATGTECPHCACVPYTTTKTTSITKPTTTTKTPDCTTFSCAGCPTGQHQTFTITGTDVCPHCACAPNTTQLVNGERTALMPVITAPPL